MMGKDVKIGSNYPAVVTHPLSPAFKIDMRSIPLRISIFFLSTAVENENQRLPEQILINRSLLTQPCFCRLCTIGHKTLPVRYSRTKEIRH